MLMLLLLIIPRTSLRFWQKQVEGKVTHLRSFVEEWKAEERQVEDNLEGIRKATSAQMRVILFLLLNNIHKI